MAGKEKVEAKTPPKAAAEGDGDKRTVATDALETLGTIITSDEKRDAIHLAVEPVQATVSVRPGQGVNARGEPVAPFVGIVDPFLDVDLVKPGDWFWLVVSPRKIKSLRHVWTHPDFPEEMTGPELERWLDKASVSKEKSEQWLRDYCAKGDGPSSYYTLMEKIEDHVKYGGDDEYLHFSGSDAHGEIDPQVWVHASVVLGVPIPEDKRATSFSCSC